MAKEEAKKATLAKRATEVEATLSELAEKSAFGMVVEAALFRAFPWARHLDVEEGAEFVEDLLRAVSEALAKKGRKGRKWGAVRELVEDWEETAEIESDPELVWEILEARRQMEKGEFVRWEDVRKEV